MVEGHKCYIINLHMLQLTGGLSSLLPCWKIFIVVFVSVCCLVNDCGMKLNGFSCCFDSENLLRL